jgi:methionine-rich copper-binding protein CopC
MNPASPTRHLPSWWRLFAVAVVAVVLGSGLGAPGWARAAVGVPTTYLDQTFDATIGKPTADKPQSKLWYLDGAWWALMVNQGGTLVHIHELMPDHTWRDTGVVVDNRANSTGDALWSSRNNKLWVASRASGSNLVVNRFSYTSATRSWAVDSGFPVTVNSGGASESATIDQAADGKYWITYTRGSRVWVSHSTDDTGNTWIPPYQPAVPDTVISSDDLSAIIAFGSSVGVMWSDQQSGAFRFAIHDNADPDTVWRVEDASAGLQTPDDHINLKQLVGDPQGRIFAVVKTSANDSATVAPTDVLMAVVTRTPPAGGGKGAGTWTRATAGTVADDHTRPLIMLDQTNSEIYFIATGGEAGGDVFYKKSSLNDITFETGRGQRLVDAPFSLNDPTGAKDPVTAQTGLVVIASSSSARRYAHAEMQLAGSTPPPPPSDTTAPRVTTRSPLGDSTGVAVSANTSATFSEAVQGVDTTTFTLKDTATGTAVPAAVTRNGTTNQYVLNPTANLAAGTQYTATLTGGPAAIRDLANNALASMTWNFTTAADTTVPTVTARAPALDATNVGPSANVTATFSEAVQGVDGTTFTLTDTKTGALVPAAVSRNGTTNQWILNPTSNFSADTRYTATLTGGPGAIRDLANNALATVTWSFLSGGAPTVTARTPAVNATNVSPTANVTATFSEAVQGVSATTFTLKTTATGAAVTGTVTQNGTTNQWVFDPDVTLVPSTQYTVTITGVKDLAGNPASTVTWSFTTGA